MQNVYTVAQVNSYIKNMFTQDFMLQSVSVKGEVSNCKYHSSGHIYFTLKDRSGTIACVMFAGSRSGLAFRMEEGQQIIVQGTVDVYERDGRYQLYAKKIALDGAGDLFEKFERLKRELEDRGMFASEYKQEIPKYVKTLGVVTAPTGAAVRDIINVATRRNPYVQIVLYPAIVQGEQAAASIINGIHALEHYGVDVMIVGRGGGSIEDLWAFNEEAVAQAIFDCTVPVISAVGHETDTTIADFVADLRAPTPSAAAELAIMNIEELFERLNAYQEQMNRCMNRVIRDYKGQIENRKMRLGYLSPQNQIREKRTNLIQLEERLEDSMNALINRKKHQLAIYIERCKGLSPLDKLSQGFSYTQDRMGKTLTDVTKISIGDPVKIYVKNGIIDAEVTGKQEKLNL